MIVTGGSRGIGAATARLGAQRGYAVCVNYRSDRPAAASVNRPSGPARRGPPRPYVDYAASKAAIGPFPAGLAKEVAADGVRLNAARPGVIHTGIHAQRGARGRVARIGESAPLKR